MSHSYASYLLLTFCLVQLSNAICPPKPKSLPDLIYLGFPDGCASATNGSKCNTYLRMAPNLENDSFIDFYLEGNLQGWVAVGFSKDKFMINTDVVGCKQDKSGSLGIINSWNPNVANLSKRHNEIDPNQDLMCNHSIQYEDKRIKCSFSRYSGVINEGYDFDLDGTYYLILGISGNQSPVDEAFPYHTITPNVSGSQYDVYNYKKPSYPSWSVVLRRTHGILMLVAVALVAPAGTFVSSWLKPALSNGRWLPFHQGLMITSVILILTGFTSIFVANKDNAGLISFACAQQRAHFAIGILVTGLMLINPTLAVFRCKPDSPKRPIFNKIHAPLGAVAVILGHINIGLGIRQFEVGCSDSKKLLIFVTYLTWQLGFALVMQVTLNIVFSVIAFKSQGKERYTLAPSLVKLCLKMPTSDEYLPINSKRSSRGGEAKRPSKDCKIRLALFGVDTIVNFIMVLVIAAIIGHTKPY